MDFTRLIHARPEWAPALPVVLTGLPDSATSPEAELLRKLVRQMDDEVLAPLRRATSLDQLARLTEERLPKFVEIHTVSSLLVQHFDLGGEWALSSAVEQLRSVMSQDIEDELRVHVGDRLDLAFATMRSTMRLADQLGGVRVGEEELAADLTSSLHLHVLGVTLASSIATHSAHHTVLVGSVELMLQGALFAYSAASRVARSRRSPDEGAVFDRAAFTDEDRQLASAD